MPHRAQRIVSPLVADNSADPRERMSWTIDMATTLLEMSTDGFLLLDATGNIRNYSRGLSKLLKQPQGIKEANIRQLLHPGDTSDFENTILGTPLSLAETEEAVVIRSTFRLRKKSGRYVLVNFSRKVDKTTGHILCCVSQESRLAKDSQLNRDLEAATGIGSWEIDLGTEELYWSEVTHKIHETDPATYHPKLADGISFFHHESLPILKVALKDLMEHGQPYDLRLQFITAKGRHRWVRAIAHAELLDNQVIRVYGTFEDVTEETERVRTLIRFKEIVELAQEGILELDSTGLVTYANSKLAAILGTSLNQILGTSFLKFLAPEHREPARELLLSASDTQGASEDFKITLKSGKTLWARFSVRRQCDPAGPLHYTIALVTDITHDKRRAEHLLQTNERMSSIINNVPVMLAFCDHNLEFEWTNDLWLRELGWPVTSMTTPELFENLFFHTQDREEVCDFLNRGEALWRDFTIRTRDHQSLHTSWAAVPLSNGRKIIICQNINARKNLEIENEKNRSRLEFILEGAALGAWDWELETGVITYDRRWCEMLGLNHAETPQELATWEKRVHPEDKQQAFIDINLHLNGTTPYYENIHRMKHVNGEWIYILDRGRVSERAPDGKPTRFTGTHFNITRQKLLELENRMIIDVMGVGIWQYNPVTHALVWDKSMYRLYEIDECAFTATIEGWRALLTPESRKEAAQTLRRAIEEKTDVVTTFQIRTAQGKLKYIETRAKVLRDEHGKAVMIYGMNWDKTNELELQNSLELAQLKSIQSAKLALLGEMAGGIAHEINNPLTIILGKTEQVLRILQRQPVDCERAEAGLNVVIRTSDRIAKIVRGLKSFARQSDFDPMQCELASVIIGDTLELCRERFRNHNVEITFSTKSDGLVRCRPAQISQIVMNLLSNAFDAIQNLPEKWVVVELDTTATDVLMSVTDSGDGIDPKIVANLMQPFFTTKEVGKGTGLGLSIARTIAEEHSSQFYYDESSAHTRFVLRMPREPEMAKLETDTQSEGKAS